MIIPDVIREKAPDLEEKELEDYVTRVNKLIEAMKPDDRIEIAKLTRANRRDLFVECVKSYMRSTPWQGWIQFNADFSIINKYNE
jgi:hypothetical protein